MCQSFEGHPPITAPTRAAAIALHLDQRLCGPSGFSLARVIDYREFSTLVGGVLMICRWACHQGALLR